MLNDLRNFFINLFSISCFEKCFYIRFVRNFIAYYYRLYHKEVTFSRQKSKGKLWSIKVRTFNVHYLMILLWDKHQKFKHLKYLILSHQKLLRNICKSLATLQLRTQLTWEIPKNMEVSTSGSVMNHHGA